MPLLQQISADQIIIVIITIIIIIIITTIIITIRWNIAHSYCLDVSNKWYEHKPEGVIENDHVKLLWDCNIQTYT